MSRYVALGSSMAAGQRIRPTSEDPRVTIGGNDVGYVQFLFAAGLPRVACDTGCEVVRVAQASRDHHAWSASR